MPTLMNNDTPPATIAELWYRIDKRLMAIEISQKQHAELHQAIKDDLADHEQRLRTAGTLTGLVTGAGGLLSIIALIKSFFR